MVEHNNGRLNTISLRPITTFSASVLELYGTLRLGEKFRNFKNFIMGLIERNSYGMRFIALCNVQ